MQASPNPVSPYSPPAADGLAPGRGDLQKAEMARRVRFCTRALGVAWILLAVALFFVLVSIGMACSQHHLKLGHQIMREAHVIQAMLGVVPALFCFGLLALFRVRWGVWGGVAGGTLALAWLGSQLSYWRQYEMAYANQAGAILAGALLLVVASGGGVLWLIRRLSLAGISHHWNPNALEPRWQFHGKPVERRLVVLHSRRHWQLGWTWIVTGLAGIAAIFPCFLSLPEGYHRPTSIEWAVAGAVQGLAILLGIGFCMVGRRIVKRDYRALLGGMVAAHAIVAINIVNLMMPYRFPPFYTDMAFTVFVTLIAVGLFLAALSHSTMWLHREILKQQLPATIQVHDLEPQD